MKKWIPVALAMWLTACSSTPETTWYQLPAAPKGAVISSQVSPSRPAIFVQHINVPDYLAGNGLVYQSSDVKYVIASNNLWASPLDQQLQQTLVANLNLALPGWVVSSTALGQTQDTLTVNVTAFQGRYDGHAVISGDWVLDHQGAITRKAFSITLPQKEDGYDALVRTLAEGWNQAALDMANTIRSNP